MLYSSHAYLSRLVKVNDMSYAAAHYAAIHFIVRETRDTAQRVKG